MRWREVLQKYRWTVDYNDQHNIQKTCEYFDEMSELFGKPWGFIDIIDIVPIKI